MEDESNESQKPEEPMNPSENAPQAAAPTGNPMGGASTTFRAGGESVGIDFEQAIRWPFQPDNVKPLIIITSAIYLVASLFGYLLNLGGDVLGALLQVFAPNNLLGLIVSGLAKLVSLVVSVLIWAPACGYFWELAKVFHEDGVDAVAPEWRGENVLRYLKNGLKLFLYGFVLSLTIVVPIALFVGVFIFVGVTLGIVSTTGASVDPSSLGPVIFLLMVGLILIALIVVVLLSPFAVAPPIYAASTQTLRDLFNFKAAFAMAQRCYKQAMMAFLWYFVIHLCVTFLTVLSCCTIVFAPFIHAVLSTVSISAIIHLYMQAFESELDSHEESNKAL